MSKSTPVAALTILGIIITLLGLLAGGGVGIIALGLAAIAVAGILEVAGGRNR